MKLLEYRVEGQRVYITDQWLGICSRHFGRDRRGIADTPLLTVGDGLQVFSRGHLEYNKLSNVLYLHGSMGIERDKWVKNEPSILMALEQLSEIEIDTSGPIEFTKFSNRYFLLIDNVHYQRYPFPGMGHLTVSIDALMKTAITTLIDDENLVLNYLQGKFPLSMTEEFFKEPQITDL